MTSRDDYLVGWVCALPIEVQAATAALDRIHHEDQSLDQNSGDENNYILGVLQGHNVVLAYPKSGAYGKSSVAAVVTQLRASFKSVRYILMVGIAGGSPSTKEDVRLGDVVVSKSTGGWPGVVQYDINGEQAQDQVIDGTAFYRPTPLLLTAIGKAETAAIFDESKMPQYLAEIVRKDPGTFAHPASEQDVLFEPDYEHTVTASESEEGGCSRCDPDRIQQRQPREKKDPLVHYGLIGSGHDPIRDGATRDKLAHMKGLLCFETELAGLKDAAQHLVIRGICDYADSHSSKTWHAYAAAAATAYGKEILSFIPVVSSSKTAALVTNTYAEAAPVLDALLVTRPEVDRRSLIALKGRRVDGTCEWLVEHPRYREWLADPNSPLLWVSGGPGKGKTMLAIYITEVLQPLVDAGGNVLLYYFCSGRDKNRNTALTILRGILHQWINTHPHLAQYVKSSFEGTETTKHSVSSFTVLWSAFLTLLRQSKCSQVVCVLDGLDECEKDSLRQLLDAIVNYLSVSWEDGRPRLKLIINSRPQPSILESKLGQYQQIRLDDADQQVSLDVQRYIFAQVDELASEQSLTEDMAAKVRQALLDGADGTFLWVGFVVNELQGRSWEEIDKILHRVPKGLGGVYQRLLQQIEDKEALVPILQWVVLAARPLTVDELTVATGMKPSGTLPATEITKRRLRVCGLLVKIEADVVNLVHESAKDFFQGNQVNIEGIRMFHMGQDAHKILMQNCLAHVERGYGPPGRSGTEPDSDCLLPYASQYWPVHFHHAMGVIDTSSEFSHPFFQVNSPIRDKWWKYYWEHEKNGGNEPSFTLLHLAAYLGNVPWAEFLIREHRRAISRRDNYGRTPLSWAVNRGHFDMVEFLLDHGARVNVSDRVELTPLHIAVTGQHKEVVSLLLDRGANLESKTEHGDTPLIRAIQANSKEIIQILLEHGARVSGLPTAPGAASLRGPADPMEERVNELLGLQKQISVARYERASRRVKRVSWLLGISNRVPLILQLASLWLKYIALNRWDTFAVLRELITESRMDEMRQWVEAQDLFWTQLIATRNSKKLLAVLELSVEILNEAAPNDMQALVAIIIITGNVVKLNIIRSGWREGDTILSRTFARYSSIAFRRDAVEFLHLGFREFFVDFDACIQAGNREETVAHTTSLFTAHFGLIEAGEPGPVEYFSRVIADFFEGYIGGPHEAELLSDANQACADELRVISEGHDSARLLLFLTCLFESAARCQNKGQDRFLNMPSAACLILCQKDAIAHQWLISEAILETMSALISKQAPGPLQNRACKTLVECLIIGKQYGVPLSAAASKQRVKQHLHALPKVENMINRVVDL